MPSHAPMIARAEMTGRRRKVVKFARANPAMPHRATGRRFGLRRSTASSILREADMNYLPDYQEHLPRPGTLLQIKVRGTLKWRR